MQHFKIPPHQTQCVVCAFVRIICLTGPELFHPPAQRHAALAAAAGRAGRGLVAVARRRAGRREEARGAALGAQPFRQRRGFAQRAAPACPYIETL